MTYVEVLTLLIALLSVVVAFVSLEDDEAPGADDQG